MKVLRKPATTYMPIVMWQLKKDRMTEIIIKYILPSFFILGMISMGIKGYLHFKYLKIIENYPKDLKFIWIGTYKFLDMFLIILPFFWNNNLDKLTNGQKAKCRLLEKLINICLIFFYFGVLSIIIGIKYQ
jgi:hypothetical protein